MGSESEQQRKIFVGGLNRRTTEESLKDYFSLWGTIVDCCIMREGKNGPSRGFGFVTFDNAQAVDDCLKVKRHELDNWEIEPKRSVPKGEAQSRTRKIFVGGLASTATEEDVEEYFTGLCTKFGQGKVLDVDLKRDKENPSRLRGFAFVTFDSEEIVESICSISFHQIKLKQCEVKKAESQATMRKKEEQEIISSGGGSRRSNSESHDHDTPNYGGFPSWGANSGFGGMNSGYGGSGRRGHFGGGGGGNGGFGGGGMAGGGGMGAFGGGNFAANPAAAAALMTASGFNPAAFAGFGAGAMSNFSPGFGFNGMGFGGFPFFGGFGGFGPGGFGAGVGGHGGVAGGVGAGGYGAGGGGGGGYGGVAPSGRGLTHSSSSSYDKTDSYGELPYGMGDVKGASPAERIPAASVLPGASATTSVSSGYEGMTNPMAAAAYGGYAGFPGGFGGFPATMGDWSQFAAAAAGGGAGGAGVSGVAASGDYQIGNYSQLSSNYGPTSRVNSRSVIGGDKNNRGYRPY